MLLRFIRARDGASAVEFALISPFLLMLVAAILAYGSIFATSLSLQQLAAEAARATIGGLSDAERATLAEARINTLASGYPLLTPSHITMAFDAGTSAANSKVTLSYDLTGHPAYAFDKLLPLPGPKLKYTIAVSDGDGATS